MSRLLSVCILHLLLSHFTCTFYADTSCLGGLTCLLQGCTALHHAAANGSAAAVRVLCHWGGDVNASDAVVCSIIYLSGLTAHMTLILVCSTRVKLPGCLCVSNKLVDLRYVSCFQS